MTSLMKYLPFFLMILQFQSCMLMLATLTYPLSYITPSDSYHSASFYYVFNGRMRKIQLKASCTYYKKFSANIAGWSLESKSSISLFTVPLEEGIYLLMHNSLCFEKSLPPIVELNLTEKPSLGTSINTGFYKCGSNKNLSRIISWKTEKVKEKEYETLPTDHDKNKEMEFLGTKFKALKVKIYKESEWRKDNELSDILDKTTKPMRGTEYGKIRYPNFSGRSEFPLFQFQSYEMFAKPESEGWNLDHLSSEPILYAVGENDPYNAKLLSVFNTIILYKNETYLPSGEIFDPETRLIYSVFYSEDCF